MAKKTYTIDDLMAALQQAGVGYEKPGVMEYLEGMGLGEPDLNDEVMAQVVDDITKQWKEQTAIAKSEDKPVKASKSNSAPAKASPFQQQDIPDEAYTLLAQAAQASGQEMDAFIGRVAERVSEFSDYKAMQLVSHIRNAPNEFVHKAAEMAQQEVADADKFRSAADRVFAGFEW